MSYITATLLPDEKVIYHTRPHYVVFFTPTMWLILTMLIYVFYNDSYFFGIILLFLALSSIANALILYFASEYALTNKRIVMKTGLISRQSVEIFLDRLEGIYINQSIMGRMLDFGTIVVGGVGGVKNSFFYVPKPIEFHKQVQQIKKINIHNNGK